MPTEYRIVDDADHPGQTCIETVEDGRVTSRSWLPDDIPAEARLNVDHPTATDLRAGVSAAARKVKWAMPDEELCRAFGLTPEGRESLRDAAAARGLDTTTEVGRRRSSTGPPTPS